jgi:hypothetical protein
MDASTGDSANSSVADSLSQHVMPTFDRALMWLGLVGLPALAIVVSVMLAVRGAATGPAVLLPLGALIFLAALWKIRHYAAEVATTDDALKAKTVAGRVVTLAWDDIAAVEELPRAEAKRRLQIVGPGSRLVLTSDLTDLPGLESVLRSRIPAATWRRRKRFRDYLLFGN